MKISYGYRFLPTDDELVLRYLLKKVKGEPLPSQAVTDCEIYGDNDKEPWKIFGETTSEKYYVFTKLKKKGKGRRIARTAGCGTWKGQRTDPVKDSQNNHVGFKKLFVFEVKCSGSNNADKGHWLMHEFSLLNDESDYVLCEIRNKHATNHIVDDQPQQKRVRFSNSIEEEQNSLVGAATPVSTLASNEAFDYTAASISFNETATPVSALASGEALDFAAVSNSFIEAIPASTLASDEAIWSFSAASNSFIDEATTVSILELDQVLGHSAASNCEDGLKTKDLEDSEEELIPEEFVKDLLGAEDAKQVQILNESVQATNAHIINAQELRKISLQRQNMLTFINTYAIEDMQPSFNTTAEPVSISTPTTARDFDAGASTLDFDAGLCDFDLFNLVELFYS